MTVSGSNNLYVHCCPFYFSSYFLVLTVIFYEFSFSGLYNLDGNNLFCRFDGDIGGVTQVKFSACGTKLFSGSRKVFFWVAQKRFNIVFWIEVDCFTHYSDSLRNH